MNHESDAEHDGLREVVKRLGTLFDRVIDPANETDGPGFGVPPPLQTPGNAVAMILEMGIKPNRDEDGVVRLHWPEELLTAPLPPGQEYPPGWHVPVTSWPIRSRETTAMLAHLLYQQGWEPFRGQKLKTIAMILEGRALFEGMRRK